ncbi:MlaD family protein [Williamsia sp. 1135]|uniref:MCE family protein n=1 Tax=Williamsia sp. 1135 TaxID=1889262 RepID=UPI000A0F838E|nr:MlaD family protein [Williamsia sp. 1135]ORM35156.1 virulence factor Mce [Williamsia sp. 1135]
MRITPFVRMQLIIFSIVTVIAVIAVAVFYIRVPSMVGVGEYNVEVELPSTGGLYQNGNVSYRGVDVGKVQSVTLTEEGVVAKLSINSDTEIPNNSIASVHSVSAVGEQYLEFLPDPETESTGNIKDGAVIENGTVPVEVGTLLDQTNNLLEQVQDTRLRRVMDEAFNAFNGTGEDLQRLLDSMALLVGDANENSEAIVKLIEQAAPLLETQTETVGDIRAWTANLAQVTDQLRANDPQLKDILQKGPGVAKQTQELFASMNQTLPLLFSNLNTVSRTLAIYHPNLRQIVVIYPRLIAALITALNSEDARNGANVDFALGFQDPGTCTVGYLPMTSDRNASAQTPRDLPPGMLCRVPQDSNLGVRGTRNFPCVELPGRRAPTPEECRTGYVPVGENVPLPQGLPGIDVPQGFLTNANPGADDGSPSVYATTYDPVSGDYIGPDGKTYNAGTGSATTSGTSGGAGAPRSGSADTGAQPQEDNSQWQSLITGTVR